MKTKQEFESFVKSLITPQVQKDINSAKGGYIFIGILFLIFSALALVLALTTHLALLVLFAVFLLISLIVICLSQGLAYKKVFSKFKYPIIAFLLQNYKFIYQEKNYLSQATYKEFNLWQFYDNYTGEDYLSVNIPLDDGSPSSTNLQMSQLYITKEVKDSDGNKKTSTVFSGTLGIVDFNFRFPCYLALGSNYFGNQFDEVKIEMEDPEFNKCFRVYTDNELEAFRILTPDFMLKLKSLYQRLQGIDFVFKENKLLIYIHNKDLFKLSSRNESYIKTVNLIYEDVNSLLSIVKEIQTNNKVFQF